MTGPAIIALTQTGADLARRIHQALPGSRVHGLDPRVVGADVEFVDTAAHVREVFAAGTPIIGICAAGILIRVLAPLLSDKTGEPPVIAVAEDGRAVVPLLGGHHGANELARAIADELGVAAAVTTAGDVSLGLALDAPPRGWRVGNPRAAKTVSATLLAGEPVALKVEAGDAGWLTRRQAFAASSSVSIVVTDFDVGGDDTTLIFHPPTLAVGVGSERGIAAAELEALIRDTLKSHDLSPRAVACLATLDLKEDETAMHEVAETLGVPLRFFSGDTLAAETPRLKTPSAAVERAVGVAGVAEAAALAAAGPAGRLIVPKVKSARATCAIARAAGGIDADKTGRARGRLSIVGIGPGDAMFRTPQAEAAIHEADDVVGYALYLDLVRDLIGGKALHESRLGEESARVRVALDLAAKGRIVALVSSGDAGVYGLAALAFELIDRGENPAWRRLDVRVHPGVSALLAAAARAGAPLGHDFCAISLSDLLTARADIERRLTAAAQGDFVVALYNPASTQRRDLLARARDILLAHRRPDTPVVLARNLAREGEAIEIETLGGDWLDKVDMLTLVLIGSTETRLAQLGDEIRVYTPRGYGAKQTGQGSGA
ncbi:MAG: precorrin-3B C(17)-methyltransferase [Alphaproteobacteria bacterium]|nr:precorrin-3B C(17)-methyltransferase [Alphaproteobacteria bacterium]